MHGDKEARQKGPEAPAEVDFQVLDRRDEQILDLLPPESAPARTFAAVLDRGFRKVAFLQPLSPLPVASRRGAVRLSTGTIQELLGPGNA